MKIQIGDRVRVPVRFGETGKVIGIASDKRFIVEFKGVPMGIHYSENELVKMNSDETGFTWARPDGDEIC